MLSFLSKLIKLLMRIIHSALLKGTYEIAKPEWWVYLVDLAQIVSAFATAAAVIVAIWLARRSESQRLKFFAHLNLSITPEQEHTIEIVLTIVNSGILKVLVQSVFFRNCITQVGNYWLDCP